MSSVKDNQFSLPPLNFKDGKPKLYSEINAVNISDYVDKYDPLIFCRTCANMDSCLVPIFKEEGLDLNLNKKIEKYLPIQVSQEDDLPVHLCYHCASTLIAWDTLIVGCIEAEKKLKFLKNSLGNKVTTEIVSANEEEHNEGVDSDDEPLIVKKTSANIKNSVLKKDTLQEKSHIQSSLETIDIDAERPQLRRKIRKISTHDKLGDIDESIKSKKIKCMKCGKKVLNSTKKQMKIHCENEIDKISPLCLPCRCPFCRKIFNDLGPFLDDLYSHLADCLAQDCDNLSENVCKICKHSCDNKDELIKHITVHLDPVILKSNGERVHMGKDESKMVGDKGNKFICKICGKTISRKYAMKRHVATHSGEKKYTCHHCGKQYAQESGLQRHVSVIHEGIRKYKCPICSSIFGSNSELKSHQGSHDDPRPFQCDECGRTFISQKHLYHHRKYHHTTNGMRQLCQICNQYFSSPSVLKRHHKVVHLGLKEFQCHVCSAQLSTKHYLQQHLKLHSDERPEVCSFCGKTFQMTGNLRQHMKTHMRKTQICYVCGKAFTRRCHLLIHLGSHRGVEQPRCKHCGQIFLLKSDLDTHLKKTHNEKLSL